MAARLPRGAARPCAAKCVAGISRASWPSVSSPSELARRRAGSMVITTARRPASAPQSAIEAATVVFPDAAAPGRDDDPVPLDQLAQRHDDLERGRAAAS